MSNPWIRCSDKMPKDGDLVLCCRHGELPHIAVFEKNNFTDSNSHWAKWQFIGISHWMPLPKNPTYWESY